MADRTPDPIMELVADVKAHAAGNSDVISDCTCRSCESTRAMWASVGEVPTNQPTKEEP